MEIPVGSAVGGYVVVARLGAGGMGAVYRARHRTLPRDVALKVLHPAFSAVPEFRQRFDREAELLCRLEHPNVVDVQDRGQDGDLFWMTMQYVEGPDLDQALRRRGPFDPASAVAVVDAVGQALDHAHAQGLLHRDVKPPNILLKRLPDGTERAMLTDFGIAKDLAATQGLTHEGQGPATVAYAAPEQLTGGPVDGRADVYALGAVLFELVTGRRAFDAVEPYPLMWSVIGGPVPDARALRPDLPPQLGAVLSRALAKAPEQRYATCGELVAAARSALQAPTRAPETVVEGRAPETVLHRNDRSPPVPPGPLPGATGGGATRPLTAPDRRSPTHGPGRRRWLAGLVAAVLVAAAGVLTLVSVTPSEGGDANAAPSSASDAPGQGSATTPSSAEAAPEVGTCLDDAGAQTACDAPHAAEVFATAGNCSADALLAYLGGTPGEDVLRSDLSAGPRTVGGAEVCAVSGPAGPLTGPSRDVLLDRAGDVWRSCADELSREVGCAQPHTTEVVYDAQGGAGPVACEPRADAYLGTPFDQEADRLRLVQDGGRCLIEVRGDNVLTASLRRLGSSALPLEAA